MLHSRIIKLYIRRYLSQKSHFNTKSISPKTKPFDRIDKLLIKVAFLIKPYKARTTLKIPLYQTAHCLLDRALNDSIDVTLAPLRLAVQPSSLLSFE